MTGELEIVLKQLLANVIREVVGDLVEELKANRYQAQRAKPSDEAFLLTPRETAKRLAISERHLFQLTRIGQIPCVRVGKCVRYNAETIQRWVREIESTEPTTKLKSDVAKQANPRRTPSALTRQKQKRPERQKQRRQIGDKESVQEKRLPELRQRSSNARLREARREERISPLSLLLEELGIERSSLPSITNGELMRIAEVDIATMHGWQYLSKPLPEDALNKLRNHFRILAITNQTEE